MYLRLLYFSIIWIKIPDGYQIARVWRNYACDQPVSCPCRIGVFTRRSERSFHYLLSKCYILILSTLYIEHCLLILPLFVAIYDIWLSGLTYGVYLVLFFKPVATPVIPRILFHFIYLPFNVSMRWLFACRICIAWVLWSCRVDVDNPCVCVYIYI